MQKYQNNVTSRTGDAVSGLQVTVSVFGGGLATIYADNAGTPKDNPISTDANGYFEFYAADGRYNVTVNGGGYEDVLIADSLLIGVDASTAVTQAAVANAKADEALTEIEAIPTRSVASAGSPNVVTNPEINAINPAVRVATISGGGDPTNQHLVGWSKARQTFTGAGSLFSYNHLPDNLADLRIVKRAAADGFVTALGAPGANYSAVVNGANVDITLAVALIAGDRIDVEDVNAKTEPGGTRPDYAWIGAGYDCVTEKGVMHQVTGAHHRITGGDHLSSIGGSYALMEAGSYGMNIGGSGNWHGPLCGVGAFTGGGFLNYVNAAHAVAFGNRNRVTGQMALAHGDTNQVSGTASFALGRRNVVSGADSLAHGTDNTLTAQYTFAIGANHSATHKYAQARAGLRAVSSWQGQIINWAYRDTPTATSSFAQEFSVPLMVYTGTTAAATLKGIDGVTDAFVPPIQSVWQCELRVRGRGGNLKGATFKAEFSIQRDAATSTLIASPVITSVVDAGMGVGVNAATIAVAIASNGVQITVTPRQDATVATKWDGTLRVWELA
jgi:hypothetical protein